ncbi:hypothetical protein [Nodosilinea nodulosa]|uniref:hypothetical protein n=1 Tax=Nodosilinea nodulosa TaxID=416001 RepID=UPI0002E52078|nr:hypothetical protein [Nodosilinea nodulosa]
MITKETILREGYQALPFYDSVLQIYLSDRWGDFSTIKDISDAEWAWKYVKNSNIAKEAGFTSGPYRIKVQQAADIFFIYSDDMALSGINAELQELFAKISAGEPINLADLLLLAPHLANSRIPAHQFSPGFAVYNKTDLHQIQGHLANAIQQLVMLEGYATGKLMGINPVQKANARLANVREALGYSKP